MTGDGRQEVIKEADTGLDVRPSGPFESEIEADLCLARFPFDLCRPGHGTICDRFVTTTSVPPAALMAGMSVGRSTRGTAARTAYPWLP